MENDDPPMKLKTVNKFLTKQHNDDCRKNVVNRSNYFFVHLPIPPTHTDAQIRPSIFKNARRHASALMPVDDSATDAQMLPLHLTNAARHASMHESEKTRRNCAS